MKITGCRVNYGPVAKKELFELLPRSIERMISPFYVNGNFDPKKYLKNIYHVGAISTDVYDLVMPDISYLKSEKEVLDFLKECGGISSDAYDMVIDDLDSRSFDFKVELPIGGRVTSAVKSFGPDFEGTDDFNMLKGQILPVVGNRRVVAFGVKFNEDGTINVVPTEEIPSNEGALPRQSTVDQLNKIRRATKSVTIDDSIPKMKGANLGYEGNTIDRGIESYEYFQKNNKSFIPSQNLKHLKSPFKK